MCAKLKKISCTVELQFVDTSIKNELGIAAHIAILQSQWWKQVIYYDKWRKLMLTTHRGLVYSGHSTKNIMEK